MEEAMTDSTGKMLRIAPPLGLTKVKTLVVEYVPTYKIGQAVAHPVYQASAAKSRRFLEPARSEIPVVLKGVATFDEGIRGLISDPTADPKK